MLSTKCATRSKIMPVNAITKHNTYTTQQCFSVGLSRHSAIAVARSFLSAAGHPAVYCECGSVHHADEADNANENIDYAGVRGACYSSVVEHGLAYVS
jgi:hypothetical protein